MSLVQKVFVNMRVFMRIILGCTLLIAGVLLILDNTPFVMDDHTTMIVIYNALLGHGNLEVWQALLVGLVLTLLPLFLILVFSSVGAVIVLGLIVAIVAILVALLIPAGILATPLILIGGIFWLLRRTVYHRAE